MTGPSRGSSIQLPYVGLILRREERLEKRSLPTEIWEGVYVYAFKTVNPATTALHLARSVWKISPDRPVP